MKIVWNNIKNFCISMDTHNISVYTAQCAYYTLLSFIPFVMLIVTLIQYTGISQNTLVSIIQNVMPATMTDKTVGIIQEVYSKSVGTVSISAIFVLWSAKKGFYALSKGLHNVYETDKEYNYLWMQIKSIVLTVFFVIAVISVLFISVFGDTILDFVETKFAIPDNVSSIFHYQK